MATLSPRTKGKTLRHPPPALFLGPPSHNASQVSISNTGPAVPNSPTNTVPAASFAITPQRSSNTLQRSQLAKTVTHSSLDEIASSKRNLDNASIEKITADITAPIPSLSLGTGVVCNARVGTIGKDFGISNQDVGSPLQPSRSNQQFNTRRHLLESQKQADRTNALWAEMQSTLQDVDLSASYNIAGDLGNGGALGAQSGGMHVFGPDHGKLLEGLRSAQMELAKAWARSEGPDDDEERRNEKENVVSKAGPMKSIASDTSRSHPGPSHAEKDASFAGKSTAQSGSGTRTGESGRIMEEETKTDILLARKRREANDRYFKRVNEGVLDVVGKLEEVARAMRAVEKESRDIWGEEDSIIDGSASVISSDR